MSVTGSGLRHAANLSDGHHFGGDFGGEGTLEVVSCGTKELSMLMTDLGCLVVLDIVHLAVTAINDVEHGCHHGSPDSTSRTSL